MVLYLVRDGHTPLIALLLFHPLLFLPELLSAPPFSTAAAITINVVNYNFPSAWVLPDER